MLREYYRSHIDPVGRIIAEELSKLKDEEKLVKRRLPQTLVMEELEKPRQAYIFKRGLYKNRGENVNPATPAVLPPDGKGGAAQPAWACAVACFQPASVDRARRWSTASGSSISESESSGRPRTSAPGASSPRIPSSSIISPPSWSTANGT